MTARERLAAMPATEFFRGLANLLAGATPYGTRGTGTRTGKQFTARCVGGCGRLTRFTRCFACDNKRRHAGAA